MCLTAPHAAGLAVSLCLWLSLSTLCYVPNGSTCSRSSWLLVSLTVSIYTVLCAERLHAQHVYLSPCVSDCLYQHCAMCLTAPQAAGLAVSLCLWLSLSTLYYVLNDSTHNRSNCLVVCLTVSINTVLCWTAPHAAGLAVSLCLWLSLSTLYYVPNDFLHNMCSFLLVSLAVSVNTVLCA